MEWDYGRLSPHSTKPTPTSSRGYSPTRETRDFLKLFLWQAERHADILATILARMSARMSVSASNEGLQHCTRTTGSVQHFLPIRRNNFTLWPHNMRCYWTEIYHIYARDNRISAILARLSALIRSNSLWNASEKNAGKVRQFSLFAAKLNGSILCAIAKRLSD